MQTERVGLIREWIRYGAPNIWCLYRLSTRTNQRAVYFFCQKYRKPRNSAETLFTGKRRKPVNSNFRLLSFTNKQNWNTAKFGKTLFIKIPQTLFINPKDNTYHLRITFGQTATLFKRENRLPNWSDRFGISEISILISTCTPLFIASKMDMKRPKCPYDKACHMGGEVSCG